MKKVGLITFYKDNFGSILQCYSTKHIVEKLGYQCDILYEKEKNDMYFVKKCKGLFRIINGILHDKDYMKKRKHIIETPPPLSYKTQKLMDSFILEKLKPKGLTKKEFKILGNKKEYKAFIVGSDQIWNAYNRLLSIYFLEFSPDEKKIAFAVSFGVDNPSISFLNKIKNRVKGFSKISLREESGITIINSISNVHTTRIGDPTILLNDKEWREFSDTNSIPKEKYILVHFLNEPSILAVNAINKLGYELKLEIVCVAYCYKIFRERNWKYFDCNPHEYIGYIDNAEIICTDSYHTTLFCINLQKIFYTFERQYLHGHSQSARIKDLLKRYDMYEHFVSNLNDLINDFDMEKSKYIIEMERKITVEYIYNELENRDRRKSL